MVKELKRVVITGMGAITPLGNSVDAFWKNIAAGNSGVDYITRFDTPPTINTTEIEPEWEKKFNFTLGQAQKKVMQYAMSNTFGFGGHIATLVFKKYPV